jgi:hypothetical protein
LELRILKGLWAHFAELRILKDLEEEEVESSKLKVESQMANVHREEV